MSEAVAPNLLMGTVAILAQGTLSGWSESLAFLLRVRIPLGDFFNFLLFLGRES